MVKACKNSAGDDCKPYTNKEKMECGKGEKECTKFYVKGKSGGLDCRAKNGCD